MRLDFDFLLLLDALVFRNCNNGGGNLSVRAGLEMKNKRQSSCNVSSGRQTNCSKPPQSRCGNITTTPHMDVTSKYVSPMFGLQPMMHVGKYVIH
ncbi:hypothetical protein RYX36_015453 [Vicia faba]